MEKSKQKLQKNRIIQKYFSKAHLEERILYFKRNMGISAEVS